MKQFRVSFEPLQADAIRFLSQATDIDYFKCDFSKPCWMCITGRNPKGEVVAVFIAEFMVWYEAHITCALTDHRFLTRRLLHAACSTLFSRAVRITAMARPDNPKSIRILEHLGFRYEGYLRMGIDGRWDGLLYGMLRDECRWIREPMAPAEIAKAA
jgi:hypothetical protein